MKKTIFFIIIFFFITTIEAAEFNMNTLRMSERKLALSDFKKTYKQRKNFKRQLYQKAKHKRSKNIKRNNIFNIKKEHIIDDKINMDSYIPTTNHFTPTTLHNITDVQTQMNPTVDMMDHKIEENEIIYNNNLNHIPDTISDTSSSTTTDTTTSSTTTDTTTTDGSTDATSGSNDDTSSSSDTTDDTTTHIDNDDSSTTPQDEPDFAIRRRSISPWARKR